jgi:hypothetical protein
MNGHRVGHPLSRSGLRLAHQVDVELVEALTGQAVKVVSVPPAAVRAASQQCGEGFSVVVAELRRERSDPLGRWHPPTDQKVGG